MSREHRRKIPVALGLASLLAVSACGSDGTSASSDEGLADTFDELVQAAQEEGSLTIYSVENPEVLEVLGEAFEDEYGISVEYVRLANAAVLQRYTAERQADTVEADVLQISDPSILDESPEWFHELANLPLPAMDDLEEQFRHEMYADAAVYPAAIQYNTDQVTQPPATWEDLLAPEFKDRILLVDSRATITSLGLLAMLLEEYGDAYLEDLGNQNLDFVDSASPGSQQIAAGAYSVNFPASGGGQAAPLMKENAPIDFTVLSPTVWSSNKLALSKDSANPNAGALYMNFRLSEGVKILCDMDTQISTPTGEIYDGCVELPEDARPIDYSLTSNQELIDKIEELIGR